MEPALEVGGDLYDFYRLDDRRLFFLLGDVSGKGLPASMFMAVSKALCKSTMLRDRGADLGTLLAQTNAEVSRDNPAALFVTAFAGVLDLHTGELDYCNAGQENPWLVSTGCRRHRAAGRRRRAAALRVDDFAYRPGHLRMATGDMLCIVSDGITEAANGGGELYGAARVERTLASARHGARSRRCAAQRRRGVRRHRRAIGRHDRARAAMARRDRDDDVDAGVSERRFRRAGFAVRRRRPA